MDKETYPDPGVVVLSKDIIFAKVNGKADTVLTKKYSIAGFPTALLASAQGNEIDRIVGFYEAPEFSATVKDYLAGKNTLGDIEKQYKKSPESVILAYKLADKYMWRGDFDKAIEKYQKVIEEDPQNESLLADSSAFYTGLAYYRKKDYQESALRFAKGKELFPQTGLKPDMDIYLAICAEKTDDKAKAIELYQEYLDTYPDGEDRDYATEHIQDLKGESKAGSE